MKTPSIILAALIVCFLASACDACPTCKLAIEGGSDHSQQGYAYSIMFMMSMPFAIAIGWTIFIVRSVRHHRRLQELESAQAAVSV